MLNLIVRIIRKFQSNLRGLQHSKYSLQVALNLLWIEKWYQMLKSGQNAKVTKLSYKSVQYSEIRCL